VDLWIVSGRPAAFLEQHLDHPAIGLIAEHGAFVRPPRAGAFRTLLRAPPPGWKDLVRTLLDEAADRVPGSLVEEKTASIAWHYRACEPDPAARQERALYHHLGEVLAQEPLEVLRGSMVLEVRPVGISKGSALRAALETERGAAGPGTDGSADPAAFVLVAGDDLTDESLFEEFPEALSIRVGSRPSVATHGLASPAELRALLAELLAEPVDAQAGGRT
jgi:trehalose 6-phosphate synthase/phosphatase